MNRARMRWFTTAFSAILVVALSACKSTPPEREQDDGFKRVNIAAVGALIGKKIKLDNNYIVLDDDGSFAGSWSGKTIKGVWAMRDNYWCRTLTEFFQANRVGQEDCQLWEVSGNKLRGTRSKGSGNSFLYTIE